MLTLNFSQKRSQGYAADDVWLTTLPKPVVFWRGEHPVHSHPLDIINVPFAKSSLATSIFAPDGKFFCLATGIQ